MAGKMELVRNIGIIAHIDAGKTTTTERILYFAGTSHRMGEVDDGTTTTDFDPEEAQRGITIYSACVTTSWNGATVNIIDTPGHVDFTAEVERSLRVLDGAVVVFSAVEGVEAQSETVWRQADRYNVPRLCFINKIDRIGADYQRTFDEIKTRLCESTGSDRQLVPITIPLSTVGSVAGLAPDRTVVDLLNRRLLTFSGEDDNWKMVEVAIPEELTDDVETLRIGLIDIACQFDDEAMEVYFAEEDLSAEQLRKTIRSATVAGKLTPVFAGTALKCVGVQPVLDGVVDFLPSPLERPPVIGVAASSPTGVDPEIITRAPDSKAPFCGLIFKIVADKHNDLYFMRVYSGTIASGSRMLNPRTGKKEFITRLWHIQADSREKIEQDSAQAGEIVGVVGIKDSVTGDTLCDLKSPIILEQITFPETVISMAVEPETSGDKDKLEQVLGRLALQDPTFASSTDQDSGQTIISGMGELHLEVLKNRMEREFNLKIRVHKPRVTYKETISSPISVEGTFDKETSTGPNFAAVKLRLSPASDVIGVDVSSEIDLRDLPAIHRAVLMSAVRDEAQTGIQGFAMTQLKVVITDFQHRAGVTNETAIYAAVGEAFQSALQNAVSVVLEPIMKLEITCPDDSTGPIQSDLNSRRAIVTGTEVRGDLHVIEAEAPLAKMFGYSSTVRSQSQGRASFTMEPLRYSPASELPDYM
ncbi:MAG: elongation factor G [Planctomycetota bacterium]|nr:elongation factor G [Planctomycetota bacterium]MDA0920167.1 elongation factor G [Planctomycetota bacterium]